MQVEKTKVETGCDLDIDKVVFTINMESKKLMVEGFVTTQYEAEADKDEVTRPHIILRNEEFDEALDVLLPESPDTPWTNPRETLFTNLANLLMEKAL